MSLWLTDTPGPGSYETKSTLLLDKYKGASFAKRLRTVVDDDKPGPASYNPQRLIKGPMWKFTHKPFTKPNDDMPGPGAYFQANQIPDTIAANCSRKKGFSISSRLKLAGGNEQYPGNECTRLRFVFLSRFIYIECVAFFFTTIYFILKF
jgi:hypothetical protein